MFAGILAFLKGLFGATQAVSEEVKQRDAENNTPAMQASAAAATQEAAAAQAAKDVASGNLDQERRDVS